MIRAESVEIVYPGGVRALEATSIAFEPGTFTVLLGKSGAGKSTLLRSFNGLVTPTGGRVSVEALGDIADRRRLHAHRRRTGMIFQQHHLIGRQSVLANVLMGRVGYHSGFCTLLGWSREEKRSALAAIERVGLLEYALRRADRLSGGQQQRVGIARALVQEPSLILADEPVASLDPETARQALRLLHDICKSDGLTAIVSLHQVDLARSFGDRIVGLKSGRVVFDGEPSRLTESVCAEIYGRVPDAGRENQEYPQPLTGTYA